MSGTRKKKQPKMEDLSTDDLMKMALERLRTQGDVHTGAVHRYMMRQKTRAQLIEYLNGVAGP